MRYCHVFDEEMIIFDICEYPRVNVDDLVNKVLVKIVKF